MRIRRLRTRIIVFFVALLAVVQIAALVLGERATLHLWRAADAFVSRDYRERVHGGPHLRPHGTGAVVRPWN
jgi:hypothetical protein